MRINTSIINMYRAHHVRNRKRHIHRYKCIGPVPLSDDPLNLRWKPNHAPKQAHPKVAIIDPEP